MRWGLVLLGSFALGLAAAAAWAAPGDLEPTFGTGGKVVVPIGSGADSASAVGLEPDGSIVVAGSSVGANSDFALARLSATGQVIWKVTTQMGPGDDVARGLVVEPNGKIVVVGSASTESTADFALARFAPNGAIDPTFGNGGKTITAVSLGDDVATAIAQQADGKLIVVGSARGAGGDRDFAVVRYNDAGLPDGSFGPAGARITHIGGGDDDARAVALQPDGKVVVVGSTAGGTALARYDAGGALDPSFGSGGIARLAAGVNRGLVVRGDGSIVVAGDLPPRIALARFTKDGVLDASFGGGGLVTTDLGATAQANALALQPDGRVVAAGTTGTGTGADFAVLRLEANGALDTSFSGGKVKLPIGPGNDEATALAVEPNGRILVVGQAVGPAGDLDFAVARLLGTGTRISIGDVRVKENAGAAVFPVTLDIPPGSSAVTIAWTTMNGTARAKTDFVARRGTLHFAGAATAATIRVPLVNDRRHERVEAFTVVLSSPTGASLADRLGVARIVDDDRARKR